MGFFKTLGKVGHFLVNPVGALSQTLSPNSDISRFLNPGAGIYSDLRGYNDLSTIGEDLGGKADIGVDNAWNWLTNGDGAKGISKVWDDLTGKSAIIEQNKANKDAAAFENEMALANIGKTKEAYQAAGLNPNLMYSSGASSAQYPGISQQGYSGSNKIDRILGMTGKVLGLIPAMYQAARFVDIAPEERSRYEALLAQ